MNVARIAVLGVAAGAGLIAWMLAGSEPEPQQAAVDEPVEVEQAEVLVAATSIGMGNAIARPDLRWQVWPADVDGTQYITREAAPDAVGELAGSITRQTFVPGEPINKAKLVSADRGFMSAILTKGMRALSIEISPETGAGGFILPNDRVDVILTRRDQAAADAGGSDAFVSETILGNVRVLAIDQQVEEQDGVQVVVGKTATLELRIEQAEILALAEQMGELSLALRSLEDSAPDSGGPEIVTGGGSNRTIRMLKAGREMRVKTQ